MSQGNVVAPSTPHYAPSQQNDKLWFQDWFAVAVVLPRVIKWSNGHLCRKPLLIPLLAQPEWMWALWSAKGSLYWSNTTHPWEPGFMQHVSAQGLPWANQKHPANQNQPLLKAATVDFMVICIFIFHMSIELFVVFFFFCFIALLISICFFIKRKFFFCLCRLSWWCCENCTAGVQT